MQPNIQNGRSLELLRFSEANRRHRQALDLATGQGFNIFQILGIGHLEVKTHSPILGEMLDPHGCHGQGAIFLRLFLSRFSITDFHAESHTTQMHLEYRVGPVTKNSGGRIDIVLTDGKGSAVFIENKIYAGDGDEQVRRYRAADPGAHLFYLTLDGTEPSDLSKEEARSIRCNCISYAREILAWLHDCRKEVVCVPVVRETITQYIHLIQELTNQSTRMNTELMAEILRNEHSLAAFFALTEEFEPIRGELVNRLDTQLDRVAKDIGLTRTGKARLGDDGCFFITPGLERRNLLIGFSFETRSYRNFFFGFKANDEQQPSPVAAQILSEFEAGFQASEKPTAWWPASAYLEYPYRDWAATAFQAILSGQLANCLKTKLNKMAKIAAKVCP